VIDAHNSFDELKRLIVYFTFEPKGSLLGIFVIVKQGRIGELKVLNVLGDFQGKHFVHRLSPVYV
jgi:hypothetical protein